MYVRKTSIVSVEISRKWTDDFGASFCPSQTQCTATAPAVHCIRPCSALHLFPHVFPLTEPKACLAFVFFSRSAASPTKYPLSPLYRCGFLSPRFSSR